MYKLVVIQAQVNLVLNRVSTTCLRALPANLLHCPPYCCQPWSCRSQSLYRHLPLLPRPLCSHNPLLSRLQLPLALDAPSLYFHSPPPPPLLPPHHQQCTLLLPSSQSPALPPQFHPLPLQFDPQSLFQIEVCEYPAEP